MKKIMLILMLMLLVLLTTTALADCNHDFYMANTSKPTCESDGYYILKCNLCGYSKKEITDKAWGHDWAYVSGQDANCDEKGYKKYACNNCGDSKTESIPAKGHNWKDSKVLEEATCTRDGSMRTVCKVCGLSGTRKIEKSHKYGEWNITKEATDHTKGTRIRTCKRCSKKQTEEFYPDGTLYKDIKNKSDEVKHLQQMLTDLDFLNDKVDGKFGKKTEAAVKAFQKEYGLTADGIAWPQTLNLLVDVCYGGILADGRGEVPVCEMYLNEDGTTEWELCDVHYTFEASAMANLSADASDEERLNVCTVAWQTELERLYQLWLENCAPEDQPLVINHKAMFLGYLNSQQMLWNVQYGAGSVKALEKVNEMLMEQCYSLCGVIYPLMVEK